MNVNLLEVEFENFLFFYCSGEIIILVYFFLLIEINNIFIICIKYYLFILIVYVGKF